MYCGCFNLFCNVWMSVCVGFVMCGRVNVGVFWQLCGCFGNMCTCIYCVVYCLYCIIVLFLLCIHGLIQNFPDWCCHLHSNCVSAKHRQMVGQPCLASLIAKFHIGGMKWAVFTRFYLESCRWPVAIFTMDQRKERRVCITFCANLGKSATVTLEMIQQGFGDQSLSRTQVFQWHARFKTGGTSVDDDEHTGRPASCTTPETVARIQEVIRQDRRLTIRDIAEEVEVGYGTCQRVLT